MNISIVIPAKDEQESIPELSQWISRVMQQHGFSYEVIFVDDGSTDGTWEEIQKLNLINADVYKRQFQQRNKREIFGHAFVEVCFDSCINFPVGRSLIDSFLEVN